MEAKLEGDMQWGKSFVKAKGGNKEKLLKLAEKQKSLLDKQYRQKQINKAKMTEKIRRQEKLDKLNKEAYRNSQIDMMEENKLDPKMIEAARIRAEDSDESESDDEIIIERKKKKEQVVKKKLNLSDNFFHGRPLIKKPPIHPFSFNFYAKQPTEEPEDDIVVRKKKKKKKKKRRERDPYPYPMMPMMNPNMFNNIPQQVNQAPVVDNSDAIAELQKAMSLQNNLLGNMLNEFGKVKERQDLKKLQQDEEFAQMEMRFSEFDRHHNAVRGITSLKNDLDRASNEAGLARIRAGFTQERMMDEFRKQIDEVKRTNFRDIGMRSLKNFNTGPQAPQVIYQDDLSYGGGRRPRKRKKKKKKPKRIKQPTNQGPLYSEEQVKKITDRIVKEKLKEAMEARSSLPQENQNINKSQYQGRERKKREEVIQGPGGITILNNPGEAPMVIMPDEKASTVISSKTGSTRRSRKKYNPMDDFMNKMMMMNMMNMMNQKKRSRTPKKEKKEEEAILIPLIDEEMFQKKTKKKKKKKKKKKQRAGVEIDPPRDNLKDGFDFPMEGTQSTFKVDPLEVLDYDDPPEFENQPNKIEKPVPKPETEPDDQIDDDPEENNDLENGLKKMWKMYKILYYIKMRDQIFKAKLFVKYSTINKYFDDDIEDVTDRSLFMFKKQLEPVSKQLLIEGDYDINIDVSEEARDALKDRISWIMDELIDLAQMKFDKAFPHPIVLSYLSNLSLPNCYVPDEDLTQFEFERIPFAATGMTKHDMPKEVTKMLIGGFLLVKMLCFHLYFRTYEYHTQAEISPEYKRYFKLIGLVIYTAYIELYYERLPANPDNIQDITMINEVPQIRKEQLYYKQSDEGKDLPVDIEKNFVVGAPTIDDISFLNEVGMLDEVKDQVDQFLDNMYDQVMFQQENEALPRLQILIDDREYLANRVKDINPNYYEETLSWVREMRIKLHLDESANYR